MTIATLRQELPNKERSVKDLIRFVQNRTDDNPNYSLLLGAGCSITSGIRSARDLIGTWRKDVYETSRDAASAPPYSDEAATTLFSTPPHSAWYDRRNEYASLFEKRFDLPRQRRMFIEQEVKDKTPSLGYAYLVNLVKAGYFRTIFTTNFDDLLNEAFFLCSDERPIVCAHDSAISSVTVTSKRPKIIKLHGDYLFDDIKSTMRETESLEENMKSKFLEFAKDYGLVIVGYAGHDRSIIDILHYLLKRDEYLKHGLYWCFRHGDAANDEVRKLLWKDRVYYVGIDGFDEMFADCNATLGRGQLPITTTVISHRTEELVSSFLQNKWLNESPSHVIKADLQRFRDEAKSDFLAKIIDTFETQSNGAARHSSDKSIQRRTARLSFREKAALFQLQEKYTTKRYKEVISDSESLGLGPLSDVMRTDLAQLQASCYLKLGQERDALARFRLLSELEPHRVGHLLNVAEYAGDFEQQMAAIQKASELSPYTSSIYVQKAHILISTLRSSLLARKDEIKKEFLQAVDMAIARDPSYTNPCVKLKADYLMNEGRDDPRAVADIESLLQSVKKQNPESFVYVSLIVDLDLKKKIQDPEILRNVERVASATRNSKDARWTQLVLKIMAKANDRAAISKKLVEWDERFGDDDDYLYAKATILLQKFGRLGDAIDALKRSIEEYMSNDRVSMLMNWLIYAGRLDEARTLRSDYMDPGCIEEDIELAAASGDHGAALRCARKLLEREPQSKSFAIAETFELLKAKEFGECEERARYYCEKTGWADVAFVVNYELARKASGNRIKEERIAKLLNVADSASDRVALTALLGQTDKCLEHIEEALKEGLVFKYSSANWVVLDGVRGDPRYDKLMARSVDSEGQDGALSVVG